jgi:hypothetical protein
VGLGRISYASSSEQLMRWLGELNVPEPPLTILPVQQVVPGIVVEGPAPELTDEIRGLFRKMLGAEA